MNISTSRLKISLIAENVDLDYFWDASYNSQETTHIKKFARIRNDS